MLNAVTEEQTEISRTQRCCGIKHICLFVVIVTADEQTLKNEHSIILSFNLSVCLSTVAVGAVVVSGQEYVILVGEKSKEEVAFGSSLVLRCFLNTTISESFWVRWHFNASGSSFSDYSNISQKSFDNKTTKEILRDEHGNILAEHVIPNVTLENSGWYICKVTARIPLYHEYISNGTQVVISKYTQSANI